METTNDPRRSSEKTQDPDKDDDALEQSDTRRSSKAVTFIRGLIKKPSVTATRTSSPLDEPEKRVLTEHSLGGYEHTAFNFPTWKKWTICSVVFVVQVSMNVNAAIYGNAVPGMTKEFDISETQAKRGQAIFLITYAFGCELWAPWSEELGRKWVLQGSLCFVNIFQIQCGLSKNFPTVFAGRFLGGLSSAGGSVTLGMVADMFEPGEQQYAVAFIVLSSVCGSVVAPIVGGPITQYADWRWVFWLQLIFGVFAQVIHFLVPETRSSIMLDKEAKRRRKNVDHPNHDPNIYGPNEGRGSFWQRTSFKHSCTLMWRPYQFLLTEPIVGLLSLLSGFSDALVFSALDSLAMVMSQWDFNYVQIGASFSALIIGYIIAYISFLVVYRQDRNTMRRPNDTYDETKITPERRLWWLLYTVPLMPIGLFGLGWVAMGPGAGIPWIAPLIFVVLIGIANTAIYMATIDYMIASYGAFSASATGGNGWCRDLLAGCAALYTKPFYTYFQSHPKYTLTIPTLILSGIGLILIIPVYVFYVYGEYFRKKSPFAQNLAQEREANKDEREEAIAVSRNPTPYATPMVSRRNSLEDGSAPRQRGPRGYRSAPGSRRTSFELTRTPSHKTYDHAGYSTERIERRVDVDAASFS